MPNHPVPLGVSSRARARLTRHLEAFDAARAHLQVADEAQLRSTYDRQRQLLAAGQGEADLALVLAIGAELAVRTLGLDPRPGQILVSAGLAEGHFVEFPTGEGKTLAIAMAALWLAPAHGGIHVATANEYLAERDQATMAALYASAGLTVGLVTGETPPHERREEYRHDVVYGTLPRFAGDLLADQLVTDTRAQLSPRTGALVVDEADAILVDSALTQFVTNGTGRRPPELARFWALANRLQLGTDYEVDERRRTVWLTEQGIARTADELGISEPYRNPNAIQWLHAALMVRTFYREGREYIVVDGSAVLLDPVSGRPRPNAQLGQGLQPMLDTAVGVAPRPLPVVFASASTREITTRYQHVSGTAGTLGTDADELRLTYGRQTLVVGPHHPLRLVTHPDRVYLTRQDKLDALVRETLDRHQENQPVLIGTSSVIDAEAIHQQLTAAGLPVNLLTARDNAGESNIIAEAGKPGAVTVAARMAGRGVDISVSATHPGGLCVIAAERFENRRTDRQLRGRTARGGLPGEAVIYVSCEDDLLRVYGGGALDAAVAGAIEAGGDGRVPGIGGLLDRAQLQLEQLHAQLRMDMLPGDLARALKHEQYRTWRASYLTAPDWGRLLTDVYARRLGRGRPSRKRLGECWPTAVDHPRRLPSGWAATLAGHVMRTLADRIGPLDGLGSAAVWELVLELGDALWAGYLEAEDAAVVRLGSAGATALQYELDDLYESFRAELDEKICHVAWNATVKGPDDGHVRQPGGEAPSAS